VDGRKHGFGVYKWSSGDVYAGHFRDDDREGLGIYQWKDGGYYRGQWKADRMNGVGRLIKDGSEVLGEFFADKLVRVL
jgi:hypothetical protein